PRRERWTPAASGSGLCSQFTPDTMFFVPDMGRLQSFLSRERHTPDVLIIRSSNALIGGTLRGGWAQPDWSMHVPAGITGLRGDSVVLPCTFTHPQNNYMGNIQVIWKPDIFQCLVSNCSTKTDSFDNCTTGQGPSGRYRLAGDPRRHNLSLHIAGLSFEDSREYCCRVVLPGVPGVAYEQKPGITLTVEARPSILNVSLVPEPLHVRVACTAEGKPVPKITWLGPAGSEVVVSQNSTGPQYQTTQQVAVSRN
ncbi:sialic acid-binding Ig-like lectin 15, partial [Chelydra serpentina]